MSRYLFLLLTLRHLVWGLLLLAYPAQIGATPLALFAQGMQALPGLGGPARTGEALGYLLAAAFGWRFTWRRPVTPGWFPCLAGPQLFLVLCAIWSSSRAVWLGQYADGVPRHWAFILADQAPSITSGVCLLAAFWYYYRFQWVWGMRREIPL